MYSRQILLSTLRSNTFKLEISVPPQSTAPICVIEQCKNVRFLFARQPQSVKIIDSEDIEIVFPEAKKPQSHRTTFHISNNSEMTYIPHCSKARLFFVGPTTWTLDLSIDSWDLKFRSADIYSHSETEESVVSLSEDENPVQAKNVPPVVKLPRELIEEINGNSWRESHSESEQSVVSPPEDENPVRSQIVSPIAELPDQVNKATDKREEFVTSREKETTRKRKITPTVSETRSKELAQSDFVECCRRIDQPFKSSKIIRKFSDVKLFPEKRWPGVFRCTVINQTELPLEVTEFATLNTVRKRAQDLICSKVSDTTCTFKEGNFRAIDSHCLLQDYAKLGYSKFCKNCYTCLWYILFPKNNELYCNERLFDKYSCLVQPEKELDLELISEDDRFDCVGGRPLKKVNTGSLKSYYEKSCQEISTPMGDGFVEQLVEVVANPMELWPAVFRCSAVERGATNRFKIATAGAEVITQRAKQITCERESKYVCFFSSEGFETLSCHCLLVDHIGDGFAWFCDNCYTRLWYMLFPRDVSVFHNFPLFNNYQCKITAK